MSHIAYSSNALPTMMSSLFVIFVQCACDSLNIIHINATMFPQILMSVLWELTDVHRGIIVFRTVTIPLAPTLAAVMLATDSTAMVTNVMVSKLCWFMCQLLVYRGRPSFSLHSVCKEKEGLPR